MSDTSTTTASATSCNEEYRVPGEPGVYFCARHKNVKTRLRCGRCEKPICPRCTKMGPTGARCPDCFSNRGSHIYQVKPWQFLLAFGVAFGCSVFGSLLASYTGFFLIFYAPVVGTLIGKAIVRVVQGKRGAPLAIVSSAGVVCGALLPLQALLFPSPLYPITAAAHFMNPFIWIYIVLAISGVWYWVR